MAIGQGVGSLHAGPARVWCVLAGAGLMTLLATGSVATIARVFTRLGEHGNGYLATTLGWATVAIMSAAARIGRCMARLAMRS